MTWISVYSFVARLSALVCARELVDGDGNGDAPKGNIHCSGYGASPPCDAVPGRGDDYRDFLHPKLHTYTRPN